MYRNLFVIFLLLISHSLQAGQYNAVLDIGDSMPVFKELPSTQGDVLSSSDLSADVVVLVSLANHCPWVQGMDPGLVALATEFEDSSVAIVGFAVNDRDDDRFAAMQRHASEFGYNFPYIYDASQNLGRQLGATRTPEYFVFNKERNLVYMGLLTNSPAKKSRSGEIRHINGLPNIFYVKDAITATLAGKSVAQAETRAHGCSVKYKAS